MEAIAALSFFWVLLIIVAAVLLFLLPFFVLRIRNEVVIIREKMTRLIDLLEMRLPELEAVKCSDGGGDSGKIITIKGFNSLHLLDYETAKHAKTGKIYKGKAVYDKETEKAEALSSAQWDQIFRRKYRCRKLLHGLEALSCWRARCIWMRPTGWPMIRNFHRFWQG